MGRARRSRLVAFACLLVLPIILGAWSLDGSTPALRTENEAPLRVAEQVGAHSPQFSVIQNVSVFGQDTRQIFDNFTDLKYSKILLFVGLCEYKLHRQPYGCTCTLVANAQIVTNSHCVYPEGDCNNVPEMTFSLGYNDGMYIGIYRVIGVKRLGTCRNWQLNYNPTSIIHNDWAVLILDRPVMYGTPIKLVPYSDGDMLKLSGFIVLPQYPGLDQTRLYLATGCSVRKLDSDLALYLHDCPATQGSSGGPLLVFNRTAQEWEFIGMQSSEKGVEDTYTAWNEQVSNLAIPVTEIFGNPHSPASANNIPPSKPNSTTSIPPDCSTADKDRVTNQFAQAASGSGQSCQTNRNIAKVARESAVFYRRCASALDPTGSSAAVMDRVASQADSAVQQTCK